jgi:flagellar hook-associated protein 2
VAGTSIDGLVSSMDTTAVINQLLSVERQPQARLQNRAASETQLIGVLQDLNTKLRSLSTAADDLQGAAAWQSMKASSSSSAVSVAVQSGAGMGQLTFDVTALAKAASRVATNAVGATSAAVTSGSSITITQGVSNPVATDIAITDTSLTGVVNAINAANAGVRAAAIQVAPDSYRLQLTSSTTGAESNFAVTGLDLVGDTLALVTGQDADVLVGGAAPGAYHITAPTNALALMPGVTANLTQTATNVTVDVTANDTGIADKVAALVNSANVALTAIAQRSGFDPDTGVAGALLGNSAVTSLQRQILDTVSVAIGNKSLASAGIQLTKTGTINFDRAKFLTAFAADPTLTASLFRPGGTFTPAGPNADLVSFIGAGDRVIPGSYAITVSQAARRAEATVTGVFAAGQELQIGVGATAKTYTLGAGDTDAATLAANLNQFAAANSLAITATVDAGDLVIRTNAYGSSTALTVTTTAPGLSASATTPGLDVVGTINGVAANGNGQVLAAPATTPAIGGLTVLITASAADVATAAGNPLGTFDFRAGFAQRVATIVAGATDLVDGTLTTAITGKQSQVDQFTKQIADWDVRLALRERTLRQQFTTMETALGRLRDQSNWLAGQIGSLPSSSQ